MQPAIYLDIPKLCSACLALVAQLHPKLCQYETRHIPTGCRAPKLLLEAKLCPLKCSKQRAMESPVSAEGVSTASICSKMQDRVHE